MRIFFNKLYKTLPSSLVQFGTQIYSRIPLGIRYGKVFRQASRFLDKSQMWTREQYEVYQLQRLKELITHASAHVPFYRNLYGSLGITAYDIRTLADIQSLPIVSKDILREHLEELKSENFHSSKFQYHTTGGSTGKPVGLYWESDRTVPLERAFIQRQWRWVDFEMEKHRSVILRGIPLSNNKIFELLPGNQLRLSTYNLTPNNLEEYVKIINDFKPKALQAYPSAAYILAQYLIEHQDLSLPSLKVVLCGSENLHSWQSAILSLAFKCRIYSWYGQSEYVSLAGGCEYSSRYHFYSEYGITEFLDQSGMQAKNGQLGEIVATGFNNFAMPLIRYRTEDIALVSENQACDCGRHYPLVDIIEGRIQEAIVTKKGNLISMTAINMHSDVFDNVYQFQFYQDTPGKVALRLLTKLGYNDHDERKIYQELYKKLRDQVDLELEYVKSIPKTQRGKTSFLIQKLPINFGHNYDRV